MPPIEALILDLLRHRGPMTGDEIVRSMPGFGAEHARAQIWGMALSDRLAVVRGPHFALPVMESTDMRAILCQIPQSQRASAEKRIRSAELLGWQDISLWQWLDKSLPTEDDLTGVDPKGKFRFIP